MAGYCEDGKQELHQFNFESIGVREASCSSSYAAKRPHIIETTALIARANEIKALSPKSS